MRITVHDLAASPDYEWVCAFRLAGGTAVYDQAEYPTRRAEKVRIVHVGAGLRGGLHVVTRYVEPETEIEPVVVESAYPTWGPGFASWTEFQAEQPLARGVGETDGK